MSEANESELKGVNGKATARKGCAESVHAKYAALMRELDPNLSPDEPAYQVAIVMLVGVTMRTASVETLARVTALKTDVVRTLLHKLRVAGILDCYRWHPSDWTDEKAGAIAFWCDVNVGLGFLKRTDRT